MKKLLSLFSVILLCSFAHHNDPLSGQERKFASEFLAKTEDTLLAAVKGLSQAQLQFKSAPDRWSIEDCMKHIAIAEGGLWHMTDSIINTEATPDKRKDIKATDDQVIMMVTDRSHKQKAPESFQPQNSPFKSFGDAESAFKTTHENLISYVNTSDKDLRNHVAVLPFGTFDTYQMILFIGSHTKRHTKQILEVKADPNFPKK
ncbi:MAG: DinB family protein [Chitinophagaceae bacterium]|nr:DinB family protein [Chitinophagaceae bacterium]